MSKLNLLLLSTILSVGLIPAGAAQAQDERPRISKKHLQDGRLGLVNRSFIKRQHARVRCGKGETKTLIVHGIEDNFSPSGSEPLNKSARVASNPAPGWSQGNAASFDNMRVNRKVFDSITMPANVKSGKVMIGMREIGEQVNTDGFHLGNLGVAGLSANQRAAYGYNNGWGGMTAWQRLGTNYAANFSSINLLNGQTLQDYYQSSGDTIIDAYVQDDHSVDYFAVSVCTAPEKKGMTWGLRDPQPEPVNGVAHVGCNDKNGGQCEPYKGDTTCSTKLPILCINPMKLQKPQNLSEGKWDKWSGGIIGTTSPMAAPDKLSIANAACTAEFGPGWRVAEHHDAHPGSSGWAFSAYGNVGTQGKRFWTDIRNQPNGICWNRAQ